MPWPSPWASPPWPSHEPLFPGLRKIYLRDAYTISSPNLSRPAFSPPSSLEKAHPGLHRGGGLILRHPAAPRQRDGEETGEGTHEQFPHEGGLHDRTRTRFHVRQRGRRRGAIAAGASFYADIPHHSVVRNCRNSRQEASRDRWHVRPMEDEPRAWLHRGGIRLRAKAFHRHQRPGLLPDAENLGMAVMGEIPCVVVNVHGRAPPRHGTKPAQGDVMQAGGAPTGTTASSPWPRRRCRNATTSRSGPSPWPTGSALRDPARRRGGGQADENVRFRSPPLKRGRHGPADCPPEAYRPFAVDPEEKVITPLPPFGSDYIFRITGSMHDETEAREPRRRTPTG